MQEQRLEEASSVVSSMPMTGLEAIWAAGTICSVGEIGRGLIIGQNPVF